MPWETIVMFATAVLGGLFVLAMIGLALYDDWDTPCGPRSRGRSR